ncbi:MAG: ferredoxin [Methanosphaera sp.]|nr:ferredoxin [Methanosphaera sp.]
MNINVNYEKCNGINCLECLDLCPMNVFTVKDDKLIVYDLEKCCICQLCQEICEQKAITLIY